MINWADIVFVMERKHMQILKQNFPLGIASKPIINLDIEDNYQFNAPELIDILKASLHNYYSRQTLLG